MLSSCSTAFVPELNGKTWCPFSRQRVTMTSTMAGSSSIIMILAIKSQRGEYFRFEKNKGEMRLFDQLGFGDSAPDHVPRQALEGNNRLEEVFPRFVKWDR